MKPTSIFPSNRSETSRGRFNGKPVAGGDVPNPGGIGPASGVKLARGSLRQIGVNRPSLSIVPNRTQPTNAQKLQQRIIALDANKKAVNRERDISVEAPDIQSFERKSVMTRTEEAIGGLVEDYPARLRISTVSAALVKKKARVQITSPEEDPDAADGHFGVNSYLMGSPSVNKRCQTCGQIKCPGHYGYIALNTPIINPVYERVVYAVLNCICHCCGWTYNTFETAQRLTQGVNAATSEWGYLSALEKASKDLKCIRPTMVQNTPENKITDCLSRDCKTVDINRSKGKNVVYFSDGTCYTAENVLSKLNSISPEHTRILGFNEDSHPRDLIITNLAVIPPIARPPVYENGMTKSDQLTSKYAAIVKENNKPSPLGGNMKGARDDNKKKTTRDENKIRDYIYELIIDDKKTKPKRMTTEKMFSIFLRIKGKDGLIRGASQGKRINYSARGVLSPATYLRFGELGIPVSIASVWGVPMTVTQANIGYVKQLLTCKPPRILKHTPMSGPKKGVTVKYIPDAGIHIQQGDVVERWCEDGDYVIFNRQPTIHSGSILGYTVKVIHDRDTIGVHPSATTTHNADFDGDCATIHLPLDPIAIAEVRDLLHITKNIIDRKTGKPLVGLIMDSITYAYLMTDPRRGIDEYTFRQVIQTMDTKVDIDDLQLRAINWGLHPFSGRTLFSALFPSDFQYRQKGLIIENGILIKGRVTSAHLGTSHRSIIQDLYMTYGEDVTSQFITDATWMLIAWGDTYGFSVGIADCEYGRMGDYGEAKGRMLLIAKMEDQIDALGPKPTDPILLRQYEAKIMTILNQDKILGKELAENYMSESCPLKGRQNAIGCMAKDTGAGAKSDLFNISQMGGSVGPQQDKESRLPPILNEGRRALPTQPKRDPNTTAPITERGYCPSSYTEGLGPEEVYNIIWGARPGLIDTNLSTAEVGFAQRLLSKAGENIVLGKDGSLQSIIGGHIYSFGFGGDGLDPANMVMVNIDGEGIVPSFCDLGSIIDRANAMVGWVREDTVKLIEDNNNMYSIVRAEIQREAQLGTFECPDYAVYDAMVRVSGGGYQSISVPDDIDIRDLITETGFPIPLPKQVLTEVPKPYKPQKVLQKTPHYTPTSQPTEVSKPRLPEKFIPPIDPSIVKTKPMVKRETRGEMFHAESIKPIETFTGDDLANALADIM